MNKRITVYLAILWAVFACVYLLPAPSADIESIRSQLTDQDMINYFVFWAYASRAIALIIVSLGALVLFFGYKRNSFLLLSTSALTGFSYTLYCSGMAMTSDLLGVAIKHGVSPAIDGLETIYKYRATFIYQDILVILFAIVGIFTVYKYITTRLSCDIWGQSKN